MGQDLHNPVTVTSPDWPAAVIGSAFRTGVQAARRLEARGVRVFLVDSDPTVHGFRSIHGTTLQCPDPDQQPEAWYQFMRDLAGRLGGRPALMAASDKFVSAIGHFADALGEDYYVSPSAKLQAELALKKGQVRLARQYGLDIPNTRYATRLEDVECFSATTQFPVLIKPLQHRIWQTAPAGHPMHLVKAVRCEDAQQLIENYALAATFSPEVVLQEVIQGPNTNKRVYTAIYRQDGERVAHLTLKVVRCLNDGIPPICEPVDDPVSAEMCDTFFRSAGYRGTGEIELMYDDRDARPKMMDINPRFTGAGDALPYAGIEQAWMVYLDRIGERVECVAPEPRDFRHVYLEEDLLAIRQYLQAGEMNWGELRRSYRWPIHFGDLQLRDWRLAITTLWGATRLAAGTMLLAATGRLRSTSAAKPLGAKGLRRTKPLIPGE